MPDMSGKRLVSSSGKRIVSAAGKRQHLGAGDCPCCGGGGTDPCSSACKLPTGEGSCFYCGACVPKCFRWVVSGITQCACVRYNPIGSAFVSVPPLSLSGVKDLPFLPGVGTGCTWGLVEDGPVIRVFSDDACTTPLPIGDAGDGRLQSWIHYFHADFRSWIILTTTDDGTHPDFNGNLFWYNRDTFGCAAETFASTLTTCGPDVDIGTPAYGTGGAITATPCCP